MPIKSACPETRKDIFDLLMGFKGDYAHYDGHLGNIRDQMYSEYYHLGPLTNSALKSYLCDKDRPEGEMLRDHRVLYLEPSVDKKILPVVTLDSSREWVNFRLYALLLMLDEGFELKSIALRFETDEAQEPTQTKGRHDFCHAQICRSIGNRTQALTPSWLPDSQPSIPLDADDQVTLVLCMLVSLYGGKRVVDRVYKLGNKNLIEHMKKLRALQPPPSTTDK